MVSGYNYRRYSLSSHLCALVQQEADGGGRQHDAGLVLDYAALDRHVQVGTDKDTLALEGNLLGQLHDGLLGAGRSRAVEATGHRPPSKEEARHLGLRLFLPAVEEQEGGVSDVGEEWTVLTEAPSFKTALHRGAAHPTRFTPAG